MERSISLKEWREEAGLKQWQLADMLLVKPETVSRWENHARIPRPKKLQAIKKLTKGLVLPSSFYETLPETVKTANGNV